MIIVWVAAAAGIACFILGWYCYALLKRRALVCWHHNVRTGESWVKSQLIDTGMRKIWWCDRCDHTLFG